MKKVTSGIIGVILIFALFAVAWVVMGLVPDAVKQRSGFEASKAKQRRVEDRDWQKKQYIKKKQQEAVRQLDKDVAEGRPGAWDRYWNTLTGK